MSIFKRKINKIWVLGASIAAISLYSLYVYKAFSNEEQINNKSEETSTIPEEDYEKIAKHLAEDEKEEEKETIEEVFESNEPSSYDIAKEYDKLAKEYDKLETNPTVPNGFGQDMQKLVEEIVKAAEEKANKDPNFSDENDTGKVISMLNEILKAAKTGKLDDPNSSTDKKEELYIHNTNEEFPEPHTP